MKAKFKSKKSLLGKQFVMKAKLKSNKVSKINKVWYGSKSCFVVAMAEDIAEQTILKIHLQR